MNKKYYVDYLNSSGAEMECHAAVLCDNVDAAIRDALVYLPDGSASFVISEIENAYTIRPIVQVKITKTYYEN